MRREEIEKALKETLVIENPNGMKFAVDKIENLNQKQMLEIYNWLNKWEQLFGTAIPLRFKEEFINKNK
jgi:hypothetical protein